MPYPIQLGPMTDRLRKFFRIRGKTAFMLDEVVVPVTLVQDLTVGPYQAGITPFAGTETIAGTNINQSIAILLQDKPASTTPVLVGFEGRSASITWIEVQNQNDEELGFTMTLVTRAAFVAGAIVPVSAFQCISIQNNDGTLQVPVSLQSFGELPVSLPSDGQFWKIRLAGNLTVNGRNGVTEYSPDPNLTLSPDDVLILTLTDLPGLGGPIRMNVRGFYQQQPG